MFDAYKVGITVSLVNQVSPVLAMISRQFMATNAEAVALNRTMKEIGIGLGVAGLGFMGLKAVADVLKPASEYAHQLNIMNMAGMQHKEIIDAIGAAWANTSKVMTTTATGNLKMLLDMRNVLGSTSEAITALPIVSQLQAVMASSSESGVRRVASDNFAFSLAKALDIVGAAQDPTRFEREAGEMARVITAFQGRVTPQQFQSVFAYARQAKFGLGEEFRYQILPTLMLEYAQGANSQGGGSRGVGPALAAFARLTQQGYINKKAMPELEALGLVNAGTALQTTTSGTTVGAMTGSALAASNPFQWVQQVLMPAIEKRFGGNATNQQITQEILAITRGNQLASQLIMEFALKSQNFLRDQALIQKAMPAGQAYQTAMSNDPNFAFSALRSAWDNLKTAFGDQAMHDIVPAITALASGMNHLALILHDYPTITEGLVVGFTGLSAAMAISGTVIAVTGAFRLMGVTLTTVGMGGLANTLGAVTKGFAAMIGPLTTLAGIFYGAKAIGDTGQHYFNKLLGGAAPLNEWVNDPKSPIGISPPRGWTSGVNLISPANAKPSSAGSSPDIGVGLTPVGPSKTDSVMEKVDSTLEKLNEALHNLPNETANAVHSALAGIGIEIDRKKLGQLLFQSKPPTDTGSSFDGRLSPAYPTGGL